MNLRAQLTAPVPFATSPRFGSDLRTPKLLRNLLSSFRRLTGVLSLRFTASANRRLEVSNTVQLGEKRFVAILRVDGKQFLIGGGSTGVNLLSELDGCSDPAFSSVLASEERAKQTAGQPT